MGGGKTWRLLTLFVFPASLVYPQQRLEINQIEICSYDGTEVRDDLYSFSSDRDAQSVVEQIMKHTDLPQNFKILAANVPNASAVIQGAERLILYNQAFIREMVDKTGSEWSATSIMAHEIGHHLAGHTLHKGGSRPGKELEADKFSGGILYQMGATLPQAKKALEGLKTESGTQTHPPKSARDAAITNGWVGAQQRHKERAGDNREESEPSPTPRDNDADRERRQKKEPTPEEEEEEEERRRQEQQEQEEEELLRRLTEEQLGSYCCDTFGVRRCVLPVPGQLGEACFCFYQGYGLTCK